MSIWSSADYIGTIHREPAQRGHVLTYAKGFSNHYPDHTGAHERPASLAVADIPEWCVPGHEHTYADFDSTDDSTGPWLRLDVNAHESLNHWVKDDHGNPTVEHINASVVLDEAAARALRDDLDAWLERPKIHPTEQR